MKIPGRIAATSAATVVAFYASGWFGFLAWLIVTGAIRNPFYAVEAARVQGICALGGAALAGWYTWRRTGATQKSRAGVIITTLQWALIVGGIGFALGFFGPIVFTPGANQGPMLGIFITGPLGFVVGGIGGFVRSLRAMSQSSQQSH